MIFTAKSAFHLSIDEHYKPQTKVFLMYLIAQIYWKRKTSQYRDLVSSFLNLG